MIAKRKDKGPEEAGPLGESALQDLPPAVRRRRLALAMQKR